MHNIDTRIEPKCMCAFHPPPPPRIAISVSQPLVGRLTYGSLLGVYLSSAPSDDHEARAVLVHAQEFAEYIKPDFKPQAVYELAD